MRKLLIILAAIATCSACTSGDDGSQVVNVPPTHTGAGSSQTSGSQADLGVQTMAIQPAFTKIKGIGKTVQLSADIWFEGGDVVNDVQNAFTVDGIEDEQTLDWNTENFGVATVDENGLVTAVSAGDTFITTVIDGHEAVARIIVEAESSNDPNVDLSDPE
ncbi:MAG TPA: Ig-like domain-containing protein [bacterium]|nr:Ig-like domain-containing protein [bacterium]